MRRLLTAVLLLVLSAPLSAQELGWEPERTWVFAAGVLRWQSKDFSGFPAEGRRDVELVAALEKAGVPKAHITWLKDEECTRARLQEELEASLGRTRPGDLFVFYYTGHGSQDREARASFAPHDADSGRPATLWSVPGIVDAIDTKGRADRNLLLADCCYSGALADAVAAGKRRAAYAVLASSLRTSVSTGNWTFTECLLAGLRGERRLDGDGDGLVELDELGRFAEEEMAWAEEQLSCARVTGSFAKDAALARVVKAAPPAPRVGERLLVEDEGEWWRAVVLEADGERVRVHFVGWDAKYDAWVPPSRVKPFAWPAARPAGQKVQVEWNGKWYPARVLEERLGLHKVHYDDHEDTWDEWVAAERIRDADAKRERRRRRR
jgi:hypothetical protein